MKIHLFNRSSIFTILLSAMCLLPYAGSADPITPQEAAKWQAHLKVLYGLPPGTNLKEHLLKELEHQERLLEQGFAAPNTTATPEENMLLQALFGEISDTHNNGLKMDIAEILHVLGHLAEHDYDYSLALDYHRRSLTLFYETASHFEGEDQGALHAFVHIFAVYFDHAVYMQRQGLTADADVSFGEAWAWDLRLKEISSQTPISEMYMSRKAKLLQWRESKGHRLTPPQKNLVRLFTCGALLDFK